MEKAVLIADGGASTIDWGVWPTGEVFATPGFNPVVDDDRTILARLEGPLSAWRGRVGEIRYYGAGVLPSQRQRVADILQRLTEADSVTADSDLTGAALALLGTTPGIAAILGTGSNSCLWDGTAITANIPSLGYILGDEGSGAALGKRLVNALYKGQLPPSALRTFEQESALTLPEIIERVYREASPNRFLASLAPFLHRHRREAPFQSLIVDEMILFLTRNVARYGADVPKIAFTGSIAWHFQEELRRAALSCNVINPLTIEQKPLPLLLQRYAHQ